MDTKTKFIALFLFLVSVVNAQSLKALQDTAEVCYNRSDYQSSIDCYEQILNQGVCSAELYYNLGNAYYKKGELALAIVNYERALKLNPSQEDILFNLKMAKSQTVDKIEQLPEFLLSKWYRAFLNSFSANTWAYLSIVFFVLSLALLLAFFFSRRLIIRKSAFTFSLIGFVLCLSLMVMSYHAKQEQFNKVFAIVSTPSVNVKSSPDENSTSLFILHTGTKLQITDQVQGWYEVKIANGNVGWIKQEDFIEI